MAFELMPLPQLWDRLARHDWWHHMSDDPRCYNAGRKDRREILDIVNAGGVEYFDLWHAFMAHMRYDGPADERPPKPERPS